MLLVLALAACSGPPKPLVTPGQVVTVDDGILRTRDDQSIEVTVHRVFAEHEADGHLVLKNLTVEEARHSPVLRVARGRAWLTILGTISDPAQGYVAAQRAVEDLGTEYLNVPKPMNDDTGMHVKLAEIAVKERADYAGAVQILDRVIDSRIHAYLHVFKQSLQ